MKKEVQIDYSIIDEVTEEISKKYGEKWDNLVGKRFCDLSRSEMVDFLKIALEGMQKARAKRNENELKEE